MIPKIPSILLGLFLSVALPNLSCSAQTTSTQKGKTAQSSALPMSESSAPVGWKRYQLGEIPVFSLILPTEPVVGISVNKDTNQSTRTYISKISAGVYGASYLNDLPFAASRATESGNEFFFDTFIKAFVLNGQNSVPESGVNLKFKMIGQRKIAIGNFEGLEQDFSVGKSLGRARLYRIGQRGLCFVAIWTENSPLVERTKFFDSVQIVTTINSTLNL